MNCKIDSTQPNTIQPPANEQAKFSPHNERANAFTEVGFSNYDILFAKLCALKAVYSEPKNGSFTTNKSLSAPISMNLNTLYEELCSDSACQFCNSSIYPLLAELFNTKLCYISENKIYHYFITGSYVWKILSQSSESLSLIFRDLLHNFTQDENFTNQLLTDLFLNLRASSLFSDTEIDLRIETGSNHPKFASFLSHTLKKEISNREKVEIDQFAKIGNSTVVGFTTTSKKRFEFFFTPKYENPISSACSLALRMDFNSFKQYTKISFVSPHYDILDLLIALGCKISIPNTKNALPAFARSMRDQTITAAGYTEKLIEKLFITQKNQPALNKLDQIHNSSSSRLVELYVNNQEKHQTSFENEQEKFNCIITYSILSINLKKTLLYSSDLEKNHEIQKRFSLIWNTFHILIHCKIINDNLAHKIISWLHDDNLLNEIIDRQLLELLLKISSCDEGGYTASDLYSMVELLTFFYLPEHATIRQKPLQYVIAKGLDIKFRANLLKSLEKFIEYFKNLSDPTPFINLKNLFLKVSDPTEVNKQKFYNFILNNISSEDKEKIFNLLKLTEIGDLLDLDISFLELYHDISLIFLKLEAPPESNLKNLNYWLKLLIYNNRLDIALQLWQKNIHKLDSKSASDLFKALYFSPCNTLAFGFLFENFKKIDISPQGVLQLLQQSSSFINKFTFDKLVGIVNFILAEKNNHQPLLQFFNKLNNLDFLIHYSLRHLLQLEASNQPLEINALIKFCKLSCQSLNVESIKLISQIYSLKQDSEAKILFKVLLSYLSPFSLATDPELKAAGQLLQSQKFSSYQPIFDIFTPWQPSWDELKSFIDDKAKFIEHKATLIINSIEQALSSQNQSLATEMAVQLSYLYNLKVDNLTNSNCLNPLAWIKLLGQTKSLPNITLAKKILKSCPDSKEIKLGSLLIFQALNCIDKGAARDLFIDLHQSSILDRKDPQNIICLNLLYKTKTDFETSEFKKLCAEIYAAATEKNQKILTQKIKFLSPGSVPLKINEILTLIEIEPGRIDSNQIHLEIKAQLKQVPSNYRYICQLFFIALKLESSSALRGSIIKVIANDNFPVDIADSYLISTLELIFKQPLPAKSLKFALKVYRHISDSAAHLSLIEAVILACSNELKESQIFIGFLKKYGLKTRASNQIFNLLLTFKNSPDIEYLKSILSAHIDEIDHLQIDSVNKPYFINLVNDFQCSHAAHLQYLIKNSLLQELTIENFYHLILTLEEKLFELNAFNLCEILTSYSAAEWQKKFKNDPNFTPIINKFLAHLIHNWSNQRYSLLCEFIKIAENRPNQFSINEEYFAVFKCLVEKNSCISIYDYFLKNNQNYISARCLKNLQPVIKEILNLTNTEHVQGYHLSCLIDLAIKADLYKYFLCLSIHKIISTSVKGLEKHIVYFLENCEIKQEKIYYKTFDYILKRSKIIPYSWFITPPKSIGRLEISNQTGVEQKLYNLAKAYIKPTLSQEKLVDKFLEVAINAICKEKNLDLFRQTVHAVCHFDLNKFESASLAKLGMLIVCQDYFLALIDKDLKTNAKSIINYILEKKEPTTHYKNFEEEVDKNLSILTKNHLLEIPLILILVNKNLENYIKKEFDKPSFELEVLREKVKIFSLCHNFINDQVHTNFIINFLSITYKYYSFGFSGNSIRYILQTLIISSPTKNFGCYELFLTAFETFRANPKTNLPTILTVNDDILGKFMGEVIDAMQSILKQLKKIEPEIASTFDASSFTQFQESVKAVVEKFELIICQNLEQGKWQAMTQCQTNIAKIENFGTIIDENCRFECLGFDQTIKNFMHTQIKEIAEIKLLIKENDKKFHDFMAPLSTFGRELDFEQFSFVLTEVLILNLNIDLSHFIKITCNFFIYQRNNIDNLKKYYNRLAVLPFAYRNLDPALQLDVRFEIMHVFISKITANPVKYCNFMESLACKNRPNFEDFSQLVANNVEAFIRDSDSFFVNDKLNQTLIIKPELSNSNALD